jgi:hypothetical protein
MTINDSVIVHGPIAYYADVTAEKRYRRSAAVRRRIRSTTHNTHHKESAPGTPAEE